MNLERFFSTTWVVILAAFVAFLAYGAIWVFFIGIKQWKREIADWNLSAKTSQHPDFNSTALIACAVTTALVYVLAGIMNIAQATELLSDEKITEGIAWLFVVVIGPLVTGKAISKFSSSKYGATEAPPQPPTNVSGGGNP